MAECLPDIKPGARGLEKKTPKKVLVVDDEPFLREIMMEDLADQGFEVKEASSGREAFDLLKSESFDAVVTDVRMPNGSGVDLLKSCRSLDFAQPPVFFVTGQSDISTEEAYDLGVEAVFIKPIDPDLLVDCIWRALSPPDERWKRRGDRTDAAHRVEVKLDCVPGTQKLNLVNIGRGGMFVALESDFPAVGATVHLKILFLDAGELKVIEGSGTTRWIRALANDHGPAGAGIEFTELTAESVPKVVLLINALKTRSYIPLS